MIVDSSSIEALAPGTLPVGRPIRRADAVPSAVVLEGVSFAFDDHVILRDVSFSVPKGSMRILLGASGAGKSVVLKLILGLLRPDSGSILVNDRHIENMTEQDLMGIRADIGMMFQENALFDSLTVADNVGYRLYEETDMPEQQVRRRVEEVLGFVGLEDYIDTMPSELSGGQRRRVAVARAMAAKPSLLLFDDPTSGLDPITATTVDDQIVKLRDLEHVTSIVVTHQMRDAFYVASHEAARSVNQSQIRTTAQTGATSVSFMVLHEGRIWFEGSATELRASKDPYLHEFLFKTLPPW
jgi:phospholipid/cholesterol/gamma-HCH transport system ATP-binding protein